MLGISRLAVVLRSPRTGEYVALELKGRGVETKAKDTIVEDWGVGVRDCAEVEDVTEGVKV